MVHFSHLIPKKRENVTHSVLQYKMTIRLPCNHHNVNNEWFDYNYSHDLNMSFLITSRWWSSCTLSLPCVGCMFGDTQCPAGGGHQCHRLQWVSFRPTIIAAYLSHLGQPSQSEKKDSVFLICSLDWFTFWLVLSISWSNLTLKDRTTC